MAGENVFGPQPFGRGVEQIRCSVPRWIENCGICNRLDAAGSLRSACRAWKIREFPGAHAGRIELVEQAEFDQLTHGMRQQLMPTPSGFNSETLSNTLAGTPI